AAPNTTTNSTHIQGTYQSQPSSTFLIQFFNNASADPSGNYEGQTLVGSTILTTDATGFAHVPVDLATLVAPGTYVTATAGCLSTTLPKPTPNPGYPSAFSPVVLAVSVNSLAVTNTRASGLGPLCVAIIASNTNPSQSLSLPNEIVFQIPASGPQT